jgi:hypothetical protein
MELLGDLPDWPGNTPPKNRNVNNKQKPAIDLFNGAKPKTYRIAGLDIELFTVGQLAKALGRKAITIRMWESQGWIPKATYRTPAPSGEQIPGKPSKGRRLYSVAQLELLIAAAESFKIDDPAHSDWDGFRQHIKNNWPTK